MGIATSVLLVAVGAILVWAVEASVGGVDIGTIGWILMIAGVVGLILTLLVGVDERRRREDRVVIDR